MKLHLLLKNISNQEHSSIKPNPLYLKMLSWVPIIFGLLSLVGWVYKIEILKSLVPGLATMKVNTAIAFVLSGISIKIALKQTVSPLLRRMNWLLVVSVLLSGGLSFLEYILQFDFGIDELFIKDSQIYSGGSYPGRMSIGSSVGFILIAFSLGCLIKEPASKNNCSEVLAVFAGFNALISTIGYFYSRSGRYDIPYFSTSAINTTLSMLSLVSVLLLRNADTGFLKVLFERNLTGKLARGVIPFLIVIPILVSGAILYGRDISFYKNNYDWVIGTLVLVCAFSLWVWNKFRKLNDIEIEKNQFEEQIKNELTYRRLIESSMKAGVVIVDLNGKLIYVNQEFCNMVGWSEDELLGSSMPRCYYPPEEAERITELFQGMLMKKDIHTPIELIYRRKSDERFPVQVLPSWFVDSNDEKVGILGVCLDMTEYKKIQDELVKMQRLESLGMVAGGIAHDLNNILTTVIGSLSLIKLKLEAESWILPYIENIEKSSWRAKEVANQLLTFAKGGSPVKRILDPTKLIKDTTLLSLAGSNITCSFVISNDIWLVEADEAQISQVLQNLTLNAKDAMPGGGTLLVTAVNYIQEDDHVEGSFLKKGHYVKITYQDQGTGIPKEIQSKIYDPFFTTKPTGHGLGLAISHSIVKKHGGCFVINSKVGEGTSISFFLPTAVKPHERSFHQERENQEGRFNQKILVIDDEENILATAGEIIRQLGNNVVTARSSSEAVDLFRSAQSTEKPFDVVITDLKMPGEMDGLIALNKLKKIDPSIRVILASGSPSNPIVANFESHGFSAVVAKPYSFKDLSRVLK